MRTAISFSVAFVLLTALGVMLWAVSACMQFSKTFSLMADEQVEARGQSEAGRINSNAPLAGRVIKPDGSGIGAARILLSGDGIKSARFVYTDSAGQFLFENVPVPGTYRVAVRANGLMFARSSYTLDGSEAGEQIVFTADPGN